MPISALIVVLILTTSIHCDDPKKEPPKFEAFTSTEKAGSDFAVQGEYRGESDKLGKLGAQVIALGDGKFGIRLLTGGLPGQGWDGKRQSYFEIESRDGKISFDNMNGRGLIVGGKLLLTRDGDSVTLERLIRQSPTLGQKPPADAKLLFEGKSADGWEKGQIVEGSLLKWGTHSQAKFRDCTIHIEFRTPFMPKARGQERGNSGVYVQGRYEVQVLDSFGLAGKDNECGGIYQVSPPKVNMCFPPLSWQTYDIDFVAAKFDASGKKTADAFMTVQHNGVVIQDNVKLPGPTGGSLSKESPEPGPLYLQDHGDPVVYRNIWISEKKSR